MLSSSTHGHLLVFTGVLLLPLFAHASIMGKIIFILLFRRSFLQYYDLLCCKFSIENEIFDGEESDIIFTPNKRNDIMI